MQPTTNEFRIIAVLNVREAPTTSSRVIGTLGVDTIIQPVEISRDGNWYKFKYKDREGWSVRRFMKQVPPMPQPGEDFPWMKIAESEKGVADIPGKEDNPRVLEYLRSTRKVNRGIALKDETPWCSAFVNWSVTQAGYEGTNDPVARSWLYWGQAVSKPCKGCITVFRRDQHFGHVGFYLEETDTLIKVLGGNQLNPATQKSEVSEKYYLKSNLMGYRIPK